MAGEQITVAVTQVNEQRRGYQNITLTNWTNTNEPEINEGGRVEIQNALYKFAANEDIDASNNWAGFANDTQIYGYYLVGGGGASVTCELTDVAPTWQEQFGGWYDTASDTNRFWGGIYKDGGGNYADKFLYDGRELKQADAFQIDERGALTTTGGIYAVNYNIIPKVIDIGAWNMDSTGRVDIAHGLTYADIISVGVLIRNDADTFRSTFTGGTLAEPSYTTAVDVLGEIRVAATNINLLRKADVLGFDNANFSGGANRGWITIWYKV